MMVMSVPESWLATLPDGTNGWYLHGGTDLDRSASASWIEFWSI